MAYIMIDVEADGPCPGLYSMLSIGAVVVEPSLSQTFYTELRPITENYRASSLEVCGFTREQTLKFPEASQGMKKFKDWLTSLGEKRLIFVSDTVGFDYQYINFYFWYFFNENPLGHSGISLGSLYKGAVRDMYKSFKHLRKTKHTHNALDDAIGNAEAMLAMDTQTPIAGIKREYR